ncbi:MAG: TraR/DksA family transcriptional regulator [Candidatus Omnitrophica bacterium]|nr:TraR/DksA family transcriptional regulator [Candidatus Omnitrophota bacterium]
MPQNGYKKTLLKLKEDLSHDISNMAINPEGGETDSGHVMHMADVATDMYDREFNLGLASSEREVLGKIDTALRRLEDGTYGLCTECKKAIASARLKAIPYVETCLKCQENIEKKS